MSQSTITENKYLSIHRNGIGKKKVYQISNKKRNRKMNKPLKGISPILLVKLIPFVLK